MAVGGSRPLWFVFGRLWAVVSFGLYLTNLFEVKGGYVRAKGWLIGLSD